MTTEQEDKLRLTKIQNLLEKLKDDVDEINTLYIETDSLKDSFSSHIIQLKFNINKASKVVNGLLGE